MNTVLLLSGGLDSVTLLAHLKDEGRTVYCLSFYYGQTHQRELDSADYFARKYKCRHEIAHLPGIFYGSALTNDKPMPEGHYTEESMKATVVPNRNMVMLSIAASRAIAIGAHTVAYAAHQDDHGIYPDCRYEFVQRMRAVLQICDWSPVSLYTPFLYWKKKDIATHARLLNVDIDKTWSCYAGGDEPCGKCGACSARQEALA